MRKENTAEYLIKRILAAGLDCSLLGPAMYLAAFCYVQLSGLTGEAYQGIAFVVILSILMPVEMLVILIADTAPWQTVMPFYLLLLLLLIVEWGMLCGQDLLFSGRSVGKLCVGLRAVRLDGRMLRVSDIFLRNLLKVLSRYLHFLPMITAIFTKKKQTIHDILGKTYVVDGT